MGVVEYKGGICSETLSQERIKNREIGHRVKRTWPVEYGREVVKEIVEQ